MGFNWFAFAAKVPLVIQGIMGIVNKIKGASGAEKKAAVLEAIPESVALAEFGIGKDLFNDPVIASLVGAYIDAEKAVWNARAALKQGILTKTPPPVVE